jgi:hypothetical protein
MLGKASTYEQSLGEKEQSFAAKGIMGAAGGGRGKHAHIARQEDKTRTQ